MCGQFLNIFGSIAMIGFLTSFGNKLLKSGSSLRSLLVVNSFMCSIETKSSWWFFLGLGGCVGFSLLCSLGIGTCFFCCCCCHCCCCCCQTLESCLRYGLLNQNFYVLFFNSYSLFSNSFSIKKHVFLNSSFSFLSNSFSFMRIFTYWRSQLIFYPS